MPAGNFIYTIRLSGRSGTAAPTDFIQLTGVASFRFAICGITMGNTSATSAQGTQWAWTQVQTAATGNAFVLQGVDLGNSRAAVTTAITVTTSGTGTRTTFEEWAFDIVGSYTKWYPPGKELWMQGAINLDLEKVVGADTSTWAGTCYIAE
jgi:hypothetical protein